MKVEQRRFETTSGWRVTSGELAGATAQLVLVFGGRHLLAAGTGLDALRQAYPGARFVIASSSGEIVGTEVIEERISATAISFSQTEVRCAAIDVRQTDESYEVGRKLAQDLVGPDLVHVFVLSDGQQVNGAELARGFSERLPSGVHLTGGMAGDGARFECTLVGLDEPPAANRVVAIGFYGRNLAVGFGCAGGWETFGPERKVTRAAGSVLYELDGQSALQLYKEYLGDQAAELPGSALRFPLGIRFEGSNETVVRTILSVDENAGTMTFAGDIPEGTQAWLMRASYEDLIGGAEQAAEQAKQNGESDLAICVSCVGRRLVLGQRTEEETEEVRAVLGVKPVITGFYSYGELAPSSDAPACQLHNETMTITTLREG